MDAQRRIDSEIGLLREVVLHRPGIELKRLTPANKQALLFDELVWVTKAQEEHDAFADLLRAEGVTVHLLADLLADVLGQSAIAEEVIQRVATAETCGVELVDRVRGHLLGLDPGDLASTLIGGLTVGEAPGASAGFAGGMLGANAFLLPPLPNAVFTRDPSAWIGDGVVLSPMRMQARWEERHLWWAVYRHHPAVRAPEERIWYGRADRDYFPATLEGGDILVLSPDCVAVGVSERSHPIAVENLAAALFEADVARWLLAVDLPRGRGTMHLDTVLTVVDRDAVVLWPRVREGSAIHRIEPGAGGRMRVREEPDLVAALADALGVDALRVIDTGEDELAADREQWDDGNNTLALRPGVVVAYERNVDTNRRLEEAGVEVRTISSYELPRGRGGPRCMSCPVSRDPL
jgi:arginine deiminase